MKQALLSFSKTLIAGLLIVVPIYLAFLLLLKGMKAVVGLVQPFARLLPESLPAETLLSLLLVIVIFYIIGFAVRTRAGRAARKQMERALFERIPGYTLLRSLTQQAAGDSIEKVWKPALVDTDDGALVLAFIIEEFEDGRYTVFIPSIPTPLAGAVFVLERNRVHPVNVPFTEALKVVSRWGSGAKDLVAAIESESKAKPQ